MNKYKLVNQAQWDDMLGGETPDEILERLGSPRNNPRSNPQENREGQETLQAHERQRTRKIETKKIDIGDARIVGEGGCWQIGYMSGKDRTKEQKPHTYV